MRKLKETLVISVLTVSAAFGLAACGGDTAANTPVAPTSAPTTEPTAMVEQPTTVVEQPTTEPTAMVAAPTLEPTTEPTAMLVAPTVEATTAPQATTGTGGTSISGPGADLLTKYYQAFKDVKSYHILQKINASGTDFTSEGDFQAPDSIRLSTDLGAAGKTESVTIGNDTYTKSPGLDSYVHTSSPASATDIKNANFLPFVESADIIGDETVEGVSTTHLKFTYDADKAMAQISPSTPASGLGKVTLEVWIDKSNGLPVQQKTDLSSSGTSGSITQIFSKYNETIDPPIVKPANVTEMPAVPSIEIPTVLVP